MALTKHKKRYGITWQEWLELRAIIIFEQDFGCWGCSEPITHKRNSAHLHHINGKRKNHNRGNLMVLCPNCHFEIHGWQTSTDRGLYEKRKVEKLTKKQLHNKRKQKLNGFIIKPTEVL